MPDPAETSQSVEEPEVKPSGDGGAPAPADGATSRGAPNEPGAEVDPPAAEAHPGRPLTPPGPPSDPGTSTTG